MSQNVHFMEKNDQPKTHLTTRRGFITTLSFGVVSLYGLWAAYGAAPTSLSFLTEGMGEGGGGHNMGPGGGRGPTPEEFRRMTEAFIKANELPDGTVKPTRQVMAALTEPAKHADEDRPEGPAEHGMPGMVDGKHGAGGQENEDNHETPAEHGMPGMSKDKHGEADGPIEVFMIASRYGYEPEVLRLEANVPYRFRIMAVDAVHGASINFGGGARMIRCPLRKEVMSDMTFTRPGKLLVYCSVYCGEGHDMMKGAIIVA